MIKHVYQADRNSDMWDIVRNKIADLDIVTYVFDRYSILKRLIDDIEELNYFHISHEDYNELYDILRGCEDVESTIDKAWSMMMKDKEHPYHESIYQIMNFISEMLFIFNDNQDCFPFDVLLISRTAVMCSLIVRNSHHNVSYDRELYAEESTIGLWRSIGRYYMEANDSPLHNKRDSKLVLNIAHRYMKRLMDRTPDGETKRLHVDGQIWLEESVLDIRSDGTFEEDD